VFSRCEQTARGLTACGLRADIVLPFGRIPWTGDRPVAKPLPGLKRRGYIYMWHIYGIYIWHIYMPYIYGVYIYGIYIYGIKRKYKSRSHVQCGSFIPHKYHYFSKYPPSPPRNTSMFLYRVLKSHSNEEVEIAVHKFLRIQK
jgi:hypothetical protein